MDTKIKEKIENILNDTNVVALYNYGSRVYGTSHEGSDVDVIMVVNNLNDTTALDKLLPYMDVSVYSKPQFQSLIDQHEISVLECIFLPEDKVFKETEKWDYKIVLPELRKSCSAKSSNSWVKAKKKLTVEQDYNLYVGQKSAWHALRILSFGQQLAVNGMINDYSSANEFLPEILKCTTWEMLEEKFKPVYNEQSSKFKLVAPKDIVAIKPKFK